MRNITINKDTLIIDFSISPEEDKREHFFQAIYQALSTHPTVITIKEATFNKDDRCLSQLWQFIVHYTHSLQQLDIELCSYPSHSDYDFDTDLKTIIENNHKLECLTLIEVGNGPSIDFYEYLSTNNTLQELYVHSCDLEPESQLSQAVANMLSKNQTLRKLALSTNLSFSSLSKICSALPCNRTLEYLDINSNSSGISAAEIFEYEFNDALDYSDKLDCLNSYKIQYKQQYLEVKKIVSYIVANSSLIEVDAGEYLFDQLAQGKELRRQIDESLSHNKEVLYSHEMEESKDDCQEASMGQGLIAHYELELAEMRAKGAEVNTNQEEEKQEEEKHGIKTQADKLQHPRFFQDQNHPPSNVDNLNDNETTNNLNNS